MSDPAHDPGVDPALSVVVPCFNEEAGLAQFDARLRAAMDPLGLVWEVVYINDGASDDTQGAIEALRAVHPNVAMVNLSRNFGKEIALTAGLDHARGRQAVVVIDADLQDPPEVIPQLIRTWQDDGVDMVYAQRRARTGDSWAKRGTAYLFYRLMQRIGDRVGMPPDTGDFRLISRRALDSLLQLRERHRFMKGLFAWVGYPAKAVMYDRAPRAEGISSFNYWSLWNFALEGITSFSVVPLRVATYVGLLVSILAVTYGSFIVVRTLFFGNPVPGYPSLMSMVLLMGGLQLMTLGVIGEYLGRIFNETKNRPLYIIEKMCPSFDGQAGKAQ